MKRLLRKLKRKVVLGRVTVLALALTMTLGLTSCSKDDDGKDSESFVETVCGELKSKRTSDLSVDGVYYYFFTVREDSGFSSSHRVEMNDYNQGYIGEYVCFKPIPYLN